MGVLAYHHQFSHAQFRAWNDLCACALLTVTVSLLFTVGLRAADPVAMPAEAQKIADKADEAIAALNKTANEQIAKIQTQELKDLQRLHDAAVKKNETDKAQAIQQLIDAGKGALIPSLLIADGQKLAFLGDSITQKGWESPTGYVKEVVAGLAANGIAVTPFPAGVGGNQAHHMLQRLDGDVLSKKPDWMTLSCGVNDVWSGANGLPLDKYKEIMTTILDKAKTAGVKVMILTATVIGEDLANANNQKLVAYNDFLRGAAKERGLPLADLNADMQAALKEIGKPGNNMLTVDGVHMNDAGNKILARGVLRAFGFSNAMIAKAEAAWAESGAKK